MVPRHRHLVTPFRYTIHGGKSHTVKARLPIHSKSTTEYFRIIGWRDDIETTVGGSTIEKVEDFAIRVWAALCQITVFTTRLSSVLLIVYVKD